VSQAGDLSAIAGPVPPQVATSYVTDDGTAIPALNVLNVLGGSGIETSANPNLSNNLFVSIQNSQTSTVTTTNATPTTLMTIDCSAVGSYTFEARVAVFNVTSPDSSGFSLYSVFNSDGVTVTAIGDTDKIDHKGASFDGPTLGVDGIDVNFVASGTNVILQVTGLAATTINWGGFSVYVYIGATL
jgi:hypothetical protein